MSIIASIPGILQILSDGTVNRFPVLTTAPSPHFANGFKSKDVVIDVSTSVDARIYVPDTPNNLLPVIVHFHSGGFLIGSTKWSVNDTSLGHLCVKTESIIISVEYRLAPEDRLPAAYEDGYNALLWLSRNANAEKWDLSRVFISGESAGGNIVHNVMMRVAKDPIKGVNIKGGIVIHPYFGSEERIQSELEEAAKGWVELGDASWWLALPEGADREHWACNYENGDTEEWRLVPPMIVFVAEKDILMERGVMYAEFLKKKGVEEIELVLSEGQEHVFHVFSPESEPARLLRSKITSFIKQH